MTKEELFNNNINIAYKIVNLYKINYKNEYEDIKQIALTGLWMACEKYDYRGALTTYAYPVIKNLINMYLRHVRKNEKNISLNAPIQHNTDNLYLEDILGTDEDILDDVLSKIQLEQIYNIIQNILNDDRDSKIFIMVLKGKTQKEIAKIFKISQTQVSRIKNKTISKLGPNFYHLLK